MRRTLAVLILASVTTLASAQGPRAGADGETLGVITFTPGSNRLKKAELERVDELAAWHARNRNSLLIIEGHPSRGGSRSTNLQLSQDRTDAVRDALITAGADRARMVLVAYPAPQPDAERTEPRVVIRASGEFIELAREQRDPETGEDARAARRTPTRRDVGAPRGRGGIGGDEAGARADDGADAAGAAPGATGGGTTVVIVPGGAAPGAAARRGAAGSPGALTEPGAADELANAGGAGRTSGGDGTSAQTGIGFSPTDQFVPPGVPAGAGFSSGAFGTGFLPGGGFGGALGTFGRGAGTVTSGAAGGAARGTPATGAPPGAAR